MVFKFPGFKVWGLHVQSVSSAEAIAEKVCAGQALQVAAEVATGVVEYVSATQDVHSPAPGWFL